MSHQAESLTPHLRVFQHLCAPKTQLYRQVLEVFAEARALFTLSLRPGEVRERLATAGGLAPPQDEIESALAMLSEWGNLEAQPDHSDASTVEEFYRAKYLYQLTAAGEALEKALSVFRQSLGEPGELQSRAFDDIQAHLGELEKLASDSVPDAAKVGNALRLLHGSFEELTSRAQSFLREVLGSRELLGADIDDFHAYKQRLVEYLQRFMEALIVATSAIAQRIQRIESLGLEPLLAAAARHETKDAFVLDATELAGVEQRWRERWDGFRRWFFSRAGQDSQAELMRARARTAIGSLLSAMASINDRRVRRSDRVTDLQTLARWFAETPDDPTAHRLWRAAFALYPTRHLTATAESVENLADETGPTLSWRDAEPFVISPRLRNFGKHGGKGPTRAILDRTAEKAALAREAQEQARQIAAARDFLARDARMRLSALGQLEFHAFDLFLDLLGEALAVRQSPDQSIETQSSDGLLTILLEPTGDDATATLKTRHGVFHGADHFITIRRTYAAAAA
jgi:uncharacterized protein (TIGR02677 family)